MLDFIVNPTAGGKHGKKIIKTLCAIEKTLGEKKIDYRIHKTNAKGSARQITQEIIKNGATDVIIIGGDGTIHEVLNGFSNFEKVNMGIIPCGTGNDFASALSLPESPEKALDVILNCTPKYTDFMQMPTVRGMNVIGMGIDVDVLKRYEALKKKTKFKYTTCLIKTLLNFDCTKYSANVDGEEKDYRSLVVCIANGYRYGGGIKVCPPANPGDGKLNFLAVDDMNKLRIIKAFIKLKKGKILTMPEAEHKTAKVVKITPKTDYVVNVDGELYENIPFEVKVVSGTLKIYRP